MIIKSGIIKPLAHQALGHETLGYRALGHQALTAGCRRSWDFGIYVAITSSHPLRVYVYNDIVLRFCPAQYVDPVVDPTVSFALLPLTVHAGCTLSSLLV